MPIFGSQGIIGRLLGQKGVGEANEYAGATPEYDEEGNVVDYQTQAGDKVDAKQVKKKGTGALVRPSIAQVMFNPEAANRINAINTQYAALPAEDQQKFSLAQQHLADGLRKTFAASGKPTDEATIQQLAAGIANGVLPHLASGAIQDVKDIGLGTPEARAQAASTETQLAQKRAESGVSEESTYQQEGGPQRTGKARAAIAGLSGQRAEGETGLLPKELATRGLQYDVANAIGTGELHRMPTTQAILDAEANNRLFGAQNVTPQEQALLVQQLTAKLGRQPTQNELDDATLRNQLNEATTVHPLQLDIQRGELGARKSALPITENSILGEAMQRNVAANQPPDVGRPSLFRMNPAANGDISQMFKRLPVDQYGFSNPYFMSPTEVKIMSGMKMGAMLGGGGQQQSGPTAPGNVVLPPSAPVTKAIAAPTGQPQAATQSTFPQGKNAQAFIQHAQQFAGEHAPNAHIRALGDAIASKIGPAKGPNIGSSTLTWSPGSIYSDAMLGKSNVLQGNQVVDYLNQLPSDEQEDIFQNALKNVKNY